MKLFDRKNFTMLFAGDSITDGNRGRSMDCNHIMGHGYAEMVAATLGLRYAVLTPRFVNRGVSGSTSLAMWSRWNAEVISLRPDLISILIGINDLSTGSPDTVISRYERVYRTLLEETRRALPEVELMLLEPFSFDIPKQEKPYEEVPHPLCEPITMVPWSDTEQATPEKKSETTYVISAMQRLLPAIAADFGALYVPLRERLCAAAARSTSKYIVWDGIHPTIVGHCVIADAVLEALATQGI